MKNEPNYSPYSFHDASFGSVIYPPGGNLKNRMQTHYQLICIHTGDLTLIRNGRRYEIGARKVLLLLPGSRYSFYFSKKEETWHTWIDFFSMEFDSKRMPLLEDDPIKTSLNRKMENIIQTLIIFNEDKKQNDFTLLKMLSHCALELYLNEVREPKGVSKSIHPAVNEARYYIEQHLSKDIKLKDIAEHANIAQEYLIRLFKTAGYPPPINYLWNKRVDRAQELLSKSGLHFSDICQQTGFKSPYHFSRKIKERTGFSPKEYRKRAFEQSYL